MDSGLPEISQQHLQYLYRYQGCCAGPRWMFWAEPANIYLLGVQGSAFAPLWSISHFHMKRQREQDLCYYQHVGFAGSFAAALPSGRTTGIRLSFFYPCASQPNETVPVPHPSLGQFAGMGRWEKSALSPALLHIWASWMNLCPSSGNSGCYMLAVQCISLHAMTGFLPELIQVVLPWQIGVSPVPWRRSSRLAGGRAAWSIICVPEPPALCSGEFAFLHTSYEGHQARSHCLGFIIFHLWTE